MILRRAPSSRGPIPTRSGRWLLSCLVSLAVLGLVLPSAAWSEDEPEAGAPKTAAWRAAPATGLHGKGLSCLRVHRGNPNVLWAHVHGMGAARSEDGGKTWTPRMKGVKEEDLPGVRSQVRISLDPEKAKTMYLVIDGQIYRTENGGDSWTSITSGALASLSWDKLKSTYLAWEVRVDPKKGAHLYVGTRNDGEHNGGLYESTNGGKSWEELAGSQDPDSKLGNDAWLVRTDPTSEKFMTVAGRHAVYYSSDRGRKFARNDPGGPGEHDIRWISEPPPRQKDLYLADARGVWHSRDTGKRWEKKPAIAGDAVFAAQDPHNKKRIVAILRDRGLMVSTHPRHAEWVPMGGAWGATPEDPGDPAAGYRTALVREILFHPRDRKIVYLASPVTGLHVSTDGGESFSSVVPPDDAKPETVIPSTVSPMALVGVHPAEGGVHVAVSDHGVVYRSADRCETWEAVGQLGMEASILQPGAAEHTWLAAGRKVLRSTDDGATWTDFYVPANPEERIVALHQSAGEDGAVRLLLERSAVITSSDDGGKTWTSTKAPRLPSGETWAADLAIDPADAAHLFIAARTTAVSQRPWSPNDENGGVYESTDGGKTWQDVTGDLRPGKKEKPAERLAKRDWNRGRLLLIDPRSGLLLYAADGRGVFARRLAPPKGEKAMWLPVGPEKPAPALIQAHVYTTTADQTDTHLILHLRGANDETALVGITGTALAARYEHGFKVAMKKEVEGEAPGWTVMPNPGAGVHLSSLAADGQLPGRLLATDREGDRGILIYEIPGSKPPSRKEEPAVVPENPVPAAPVTVLPEGMRAFTASADNSVRIWHIDRGEAAEALSGHEGAVTCVALSPDEQFLVSGSADGSLRIWNAADGKPVAAVPTGGAVNAVVIDDESKFAYAAIAEPAQVLQVELATQATKSLVGHTASVTALALSEDVNRAYSGSADGTVRVWDTQAGAEVLQIAAGAAVDALAVAKDGSRLFAVTADHSVKSFDAAGATTATLPPVPASIGAAALSPDGASLLLATNVGVQTLSAADLKPGLRYEAGPTGVTCLSVSADGKWVFAGDSSGTIWIWAHGTAVARSTAKGGHDKSVLGLTVTPDETQEVGPVVPPGGGKKEGADKPGDADGGKSGDGAKPGDGGKGADGDGSGAEAPAEEPKPKDGGEVPPKDPASKDAPPAK